MGLLDFHSTNKTLLGDYSKQSDSWTSADVRLMSNDLVYAMSLKCKHALYV